MCLHEFDHLRDCLSGKNREEVGDEDKLESLAVLWLAGAELAKSDALSIVGASSTSVDKGRVVAVHVEVLIVDEESFAHCSVSVVKSMHVEPERKPS